MVCPRTYSNTCFSFRRTYKSSADIFRLIPFVVVGAVVAAVVVAVVAVGVAVAVAVVVVAAVAAAAGAIVAVVRCAVLFFAVLCCDLWWLAVVR